MSLVDQCPVRGCRDHGPYGVRTLRKHLQNHNPDTLVETCILLIKARNDAQDAAWEANDY